MYLTTISIIGKWSMIAPLLWYRCHSFIGKPQIDCAVLVCEIRVICWWVIWQQYFITVKIKSIPPYLILSLAKQINVKDSVDGGNGGMWPYIYSVSNIIDWWLGIWELKDASRISNVLQLECSDVGLVKPSMSYYHNLMWTWW